MLSMCVNLNWIPYCDFVDSTTSDSVFMVLHISVLIVFSFHYYLFIMENVENVAAAAATAAAKLLQSCPTLCDPIDGSPPGSPVPGILQARTLEWVAISFFNA